jgi:thiol-disulfide isomerase/thioredoxin
MKSPLFLAKATPFVVAITLAAAGLQARQALAKPAHGSPSPAISPVTASQLKAAVKANAGHVLLVNFWATWCPPCVAELPALAKLQRDNSRRGFKLIMVSADAPGSSSAIKNTLAKDGLSRSYLLQGDPHVFIPHFDPSYKGQIGIPLTYIFDKKGHMVKRLVGGHSASAYQKILNPYLK